MDRAKGMRPREAHAPVRREEKAIIHHVISGPRVVMHDRPVKSGERPFKDLKAAPERPRPAAADPPPRHKAPVHAVEPEPPTQAESTPREYRIVKSRRQGGEPYLLQRGYWHEQKGKRIFTVEWEKGFPDREKAEKHEEWVKRNEREMAEVDQHD